jgi:hypothetical protein
VKSKGWRRRHSKDKVCKVIGALGGLSACIRLLYRMLLGPYRRQWKLSVMLSWSICRELLDKSATGGWLPVLYHGADSQVYGVKPEWLEVDQQEYGTVYTLHREISETLIVEVQRESFFDPCAARGKGGMRDE